MDYTVEIINSSKQLTAKERVLVKDTTNALSLDEATKGGSFIVDPDYTVLLNIHNEKAENKDYEKLVLVDKAGTKYTTSSNSFINTFFNILAEMNESEEAFQIEIYRRPSNNYKGKEFLTCSIV